MQKHEGVLFLARARAPATSNAVEWSKEPRAQIYSSIYRFENREFSRADWLQGDVFYVLINSNQVTGSMLIR